MRVLVTGAYGFIGAEVVAALSAAGHDVISAVRHTRVGERLAPNAALACDMALDLSEDIWAPRLSGIDAVVNCAGILRERHGETFEAVHVQAPLALFGACARVGISRVIQISALGNAADGEFIASKQRCDAALAQMHLDWLVLRPSVVCSARGSYGGTSLLRALAALPGCLLVPGSGGQKMQPLLLEDLGRIVAAVIARPQASREILEIGGPEIFSLTDYLRVWRRWLGYRDARIVRVPLGAVRVLATVGEWFGGGPLGLTMLRMLDRGNVTAPNAWTRMRDVLGVAARPIAEGLADTPAQQQDRWHARLYFLKPALGFSLALVWIVSGFLGLLLPDTVVSRTTGDTLSPALGIALARVGGIADLVLGVLCLVRWKPRLVFAAMLVVLGIYTIVIGILWPRYWLDPFGGLLKNLPMFAALSLLLAIEERR